jgi:hypothetical protein
MMRLMLFLLPIDFRTKSKSLHKSTFDFVLHIIPFRFPLKERLTHTYYKIDGMVTFQEELNVNEARLVSGDSTRRRRSKLSLEWRDPRVEEKLRNKHFQ